MGRLRNIFRALFVIVLLVACWAVLIEPGLLTQRDLSLSKWSGSPLRIAFFSDLHAGAPHVTDSYIEDLIFRINKMKPDIVLIGGDLVINGVVGGTHMPIEAVTEHLKKLEARLGIFAVLGNHDWWNNGDHIRKVLEGAGIVVLENDAKLISIDSNSNFWLVGIGDDFTNHANANQALSSVNTEDPRVLFMHDPAAIFQVESEFFLTLAGHMHGGQVFIPGIGAIITPGDAPKSWAGGWVDFKYGSLFVSKGVGTSIIPVRFNAIPEFVILELKP